MNKDIDTNILILDLVLLIFVFFFFSAWVFGCPVTKIENKTHTWTQQDNEALGIATKGCERQYGADNKCLKQFIKVEDGFYKALCGRDI